MARQESDREDLFAEAVALTRRLEGTVLNASDPAFAGKLVLGLRDNGWLSVYLGSEPVYHFDARHRLRRAYVDGWLYRTQGTTLARLQRSRSATETTLLRTDLAPPELLRFRERMQQLLRDLASHLTSPAWQTLRRFPEYDLRIEADIADRLSGCLTVGDWLAPPVPGRR